MINSKLKERWGILTHKLSIDFRDGEDNRKAEVFHQYTLSCKRGNVYIRDAHGDSERLSNRSVNILIEHLTYAKAVIGNKS